MDDAGANDASEPARRDYDGLLPGRHLAKEDLLVDSHIEVYEAMFHAAFVERLHRYSRFLDIGCHIGEYVREFLDRSRHGTVLAVDMNPEVLSFVASSDRVTRLLAAVADRSAIHALHVPRDSYGRKVSGCGGVLPTDDEGKPCGSTEHFVASTTLDEIFRSFGPFDLVKMDIEGYEVKALKGGRLLLSQASCVAIEIHWSNLERHGENSDMLEEFLRESGLTKRWFEDDCTGDGHPWHQIWERT